MMRFLVVVLLLTVWNILCLPEGYAQSDSQAGLVRQLETDFQEQNLETYERLLNFSRQSNIPLFSLSGNQIIQLVELDENNFPVFRITHNTRAAGVTGAASLHKEGYSGLDLGGQGLTVGVWDGGAVRSSHVELKGRVNQRDAATGLSNHATHVSGTVAAAGISDRSRGMAYKAFVDAYDWNSDNTEMQAAARNGLLISNHSYGQINGWHYNSDEKTWYWYGDVRISEDVDWRFGFYSNAAREWDRIAFENKHYLIVKSGGNDRTDSGPGIDMPYKYFNPDSAKYIESRKPRKADGPFNSISDKSIAKNILTVGSLAGNGREQLTMSSYSSWGPTNDGRIKPEIVTRGSDMFSASSEGDDRYTTMSGTSMASPAVAGSLLLLQEYHKFSRGDFMKSATLKGLALHTAIKPPQTGEGPDYANGWGYLDVEAAIGVLSDEKALLVDAVLHEGEELVYEFTVEDEPELVASLSWTDPAGKVPAASLYPKDIILVNDLDIRILAPDGAVIHPWILDPAKPEAPAGRGVNYVDNFERINIVNPVSGNYKLIVSHKNTLANSSQDFSLIVSAATQRQASEVLYFRGQNEDFADPLNWARVAGGASADKVPGENSVLVFPNDAFANNVVLRLDQNIAVKAFVFESDSALQLDLQGYQLLVKGELRLGEQLKAVSAGKISFRPSLKGSYKPEISMQGSELVDFHIQAPGSSIAFAEHFNANSLRLEGVKEVTFGQSTTPARVPSVQLVSGSDQSTTIKGLNLGVSELAISGGIFDLTTASFYFTDNASLHSAAETTIGTLLSTGPLRIEVPENILHIRSLETSGDISLAGIATVELFSFEAGSQLELIDGAELKCSKFIQLNADNGRRSSVFSEGRGLISAASVEKNCFSALDVSNVDVEGEAIFTVDEASTLIASAGWRSEICEEIFFSDFSVSSTCSNALASFTNLSSGTISSFHWDFGDGEGSEEENPHHVYPEPGLYNVSLTITSEEGSLTKTREVAVTDGRFAGPALFFESEKLLTTTQSSAYHWYLNGELLSSTVERDFEPLANGLYYLIIEKDGCLYQSNAIEVSTKELLSVRDRNIKGESGILVFPNPVKDRLRVRLQDEGEEITSLKIFDLKGRELPGFMTAAGHAGPEAELEVNKLSKGLYMLIVSTRTGNSYTSRFVR